MIPQKFKGDDTELKYEAAATPAMDLCSTALDAFFAEGYDATPFLLMLFDEGRMPFSDRVPREAFVQFIREALKRFRFTGTFESYIFIIEKIFGEGSGIIFAVPNPGHLTILVNSPATLDFDFIANEYVDGVYVDSEMVDHDGSTLVFQGISGIDSEYELSQLLAELQPAGVFTEVTLAFFALYDFITDDGTLMITHDGDQIVFFED